MNLSTLLWSSSEECSSAIADVTLLSLPTIVGKGCVISPVCAVSRITTKVDDFIETWCYDWA